MHVLAIEPVSANVSDAVALGYGFGWRVEALLRGVARAISLLCFSKGALTNCAQRQSVMAVRVRICLNN